MDMASNFGEGRWRVYKHQKKNSPILYLKKTLWVTEKAMRCVQTLFVITLEYINLPV